MCTVYSVRYATDPNLVVCQEREIATANHHITILFPSCSSRVFLTHSGGGSGDFRFSPDATVVVVAAAGILCFHQDDETLGDPRLTKRIYIPVRPLAAPISKHFTMCIR